MCDSTQGSLCPSPMTIHQCMWIQWSILQNTTYIHIHTTYSRAAGSRKRLYLRRRYILEGRKNPMLSVVSYICVGYHPGGCRFSKWCKFFLEPKRWRGALRVQTSSYQAFFVTPFTTGVGGDYNSPEKSKNKSPKCAYVVPWHRYGSPLSIHTKLSIKIPCMTSQWRHEACLDSKTADFHEFPQ